MKKTYLPFLFISIISPIIGSTNAIDDNTQKTTKLNKLQKQYRESMDRLKKCARGKCSRLEAAKAVRDLAVIIAAMTAGSYVAGTGLQKGGLAVYKKGYKSTGSLMHFAGKTLRRPIIYPKSLITSPPYAVGTKVKLTNDLAIKYPHVGDIEVTGYDFDTGKVEIQYMDENKKTLRTDKIKPKSLTEK